MNNINQKDKSKFNITTKGSSRKQIIIPMSISNTERIIAQSNVHITNIDKLLKDVKSEILADCICSNNKGIVIITNKIAVLFDLSIVEKYIKELNNVNSDNVISSKLPQLSYPKLQNMSETCLTLIQHQIPVDIWSYLCPKLRQ